MGDGRSDIIVVSFWVLFFEGLFFVQRFTLTNINAFLDDNTQTTKVRYYGWPRHNSIGKGNESVYLAVIAEKVITWIFGDGGSFY